MKILENQCFSEERALYGENNIQLLNCSFEGEEDGESALKESKNVELKDTFFDLRYPLWHVKNGKLENCNMSENCRAACWYDQKIHIQNCQMNGIKVLRECEKIDIENTQIDSSEFGWFCKHLNMKNSQLISEYPFLKCKHLYIEQLKMRGKYSFQYVKNAEIHDSMLDTKDAFWHSRDVTVYNSIIKGEYLGWYSQNLKLVNCQIIGTQPFCYCENLVLENCEMIDCDLAFEKSSVHANIKGKIDSVKNPQSGFICADDFGEVIFEGPCECEITKKQVGGYDEK